MNLLSEPNKMVFIRFAYWLGAILDAIWGILSLSYMFLSEEEIFNKFGYPSPITEFGYYTLVGVSSLMIGWAFLLIWADRKPIERRGTLLLTVFAMLIMFFTQIMGFIKANQYVTFISLLSNSTIIIYGLAYYFTYEIAKNRVK